MTDENKEVETGTAEEEILEENGDTQQVLEGEVVEDEEETPEGEETTEKKKFWKKKDKNAELVEELTDRVKRQMAEFENFRKRSEKEKAGMFDLGSKNVIEQILPVVDNFERGLAAVSEEQKEDPFVSGMDRIYKQLVEVLGKLNVKPIEAVGQEFNPDYHNAVMHVDDETVGENIVVEEFQKGYTYKDTVVRHSMVKVAN